LTALRARLGRHAVLAYSLLTILISWGCLALGPGAFPASAEQLESVTAGLVMSTLLLQPAVVGTDLLAYILVWAAALWIVSFAVTTATER